MVEGMVSVVVPIYNVEKYLDRCITSIANQNYTNLEIILVDDGSTDNCPQICDEWAKKDNRIKVVHKKNAGLGMARNTGIECATGEYICFFDSDDYVDKNAVKKAYLLAQKEMTDIVVFGLTRIDRNGIAVKQVIPKSEKTCYFGTDVQNIFLPNLIECSNDTALIKNLCFSAWACMYSMELVRRVNWRFVSERQIISEDSYSLICLYKFVNRVAILDEALYFYCENENSLTQVYRPDRYEKIKQFYFETIKLAEQMEYCNEVHKRISTLFFSFSIGAMKQIVIADLTAVEKRKLLVQIVDDDIMGSALKNAEHRYDSCAKSILCWAMRHKMHRLIYLLVKMQTARNK